MSCSQWPCHPVPPHGLLLMRPHTDQSDHQVGLFDVPHAPMPVGGSLDYATELRHVLSQALKNCPLSRHMVAGKMSELTGHEITKAMLDAWTAESRNQWRFPFEYAAAFEAATGSTCLMALLAVKRGCKVVEGDEILMARMGRLEMERATINDQLKALKKHLGDRS